MSLPNIAKLTLRTEKGSKLTHAELDSNFSVLKTYVKMLADLFGVALNADGTLNANSVGAEQVKDRVIGQTEMAGVNLFVAEDAGVSNAMSISFTPPFTAYVDKMVFWVKAAANNTSGATLNVDGLGPIQVLKNGDTPLDPNDLKEDAVSVFVYLGGKFHLVSGIGQESTAASDAVNTGFSGITRFDSVDTALPAAAASVTFAHGLAIAPNYLSVVLVCETPDLTYIGGDVVPIDQFTDASGIPAFNVTVSGTNIVVTRNVATVLAGGFGAITDTLWKIRVQASVIVSVSAGIFPSLTFMAKEPEGVMADSDDLVFMEYGRNQGGTIYTHRVKISTNQVTKLTPAASGPNHRYCNVGKFRRVDGFDDYVFTSSTGVFRLPVLEAGTWIAIRECALSSAYPYKPVWIEEVAGSITHVYVATCSYGSQNISSIILRDVNVGANSIATRGSSLDLTSATILNPDLSAGNTAFRAWHQTGSNAQVLHFQYNQPKKRIYVITNEVGLLHIFELTGSGVDPYGASTTGDNFLNWWDYGSRLSKIRYVKSIGIPGDGAMWSDYNREKFFVDHDLITGVERSLVFSRNGNNSFSGSVTRVPWKES